MFSTLSILSTGALALAVVPPAVGDAKELLPPVLARIDGESATLEEYQRWLVDVHGADLLSVWLDQRMLSKAAADRGCAVPEPEVDSAFETEWNTIVKQRFGGDESRFLAELKSSGHTRDTYAVQRKTLIRSELTLAALCRHEREASEDALRKRFAATYGDPPQRLTVRIIRINQLLLHRESEKTGEPKSATATELDRRARERAEEILARLKRGEDFEVLAKEASHDRDSAAAGGLVPHLVRTDLDSAVYAAATALTGDHPLSGVIKEPFGYAIVRVEGRAPVTFDDVKSDLERELREEPVSSQEQVATMEMLRAKMKVERLFKP